MTTGTSSRTADSAAAPFASTLERSSRRGRSGLDPTPAAHAIAAYCTPAVWADHRVASSSRWTILVVTTPSQEDSADRLYSIGAAAFAAEGAVLDVSETVANRVDNGGAVRAIVASYRWLLAQLIEPSDIVVVSDDRTVGLVGTALCVLDRSSDQMPAKVTTIEALLGPTPCSSGDSLGTALRLLSDRRTGGRTRSVSPSLRSVTEPLGEPHPSDADRHEPSQGRNTDGTLRRRSDRLLPI